MDFLIYLVAVFIILPIIGAMYTEITKWSERQQEREREKHDFIN